MNRQRWKILVYVLVFIGLLVCVYQANVFHGRKKIVDLNIVIDPLKGDRFLDEQEIEAIILSRIDSLLEVSQEKIDLNSIEQLINNEAAVKNAEVYLTASGILKANVELRKVVVRVKPDDGRGYYLDSDGDSMRWVNSFTPRVLTINGHIEKYGVEEYYDLSAYERHRLFQEQLFEFSSFVIKDEFWSKQLAQLYVTERGEVELVTLLGDQNFILGNLEDAEEKLEKLNLYYKQVVKKVGWNKYRTINLKYRDQIVCN